jgi:uncharacterized Zn ribbon protein
LAWVAAQPAGQAQHVSGGDSVTLIEDLKDKGSAMRRKHGSMIKRPRLTDACAKPQGLR